MKPRPNHWLYIETLRAMSGEDRLRKAFELTAMSRELLAAGLRRRHPDLAEEDLREIYLGSVKKGWDRRE